MRGLQGKVAIITGGSSGIGLATARTLVGWGTRVLLVARQAERLEHVAEQIRVEHGKEAARIHAADVGVPGAAAEIARAALEAFGSIDYLVNNAGLDGRGVDFTEIDEAYWRRVMDVNLSAVFLLSQEVARHLRVRKTPGAIVNVSSISGLSAEYRFADYNTSKGALVALTQSMAMDLASDGIRVNAICPGYVETEMTAQWLADPQARARIAGDIPLGRVGRAEEIGETIAFLLSDHASFQTGSAVVVDGGRTAGWKGGV